MTTDISVIKEELKGFEEVDSPFEIQSDRFIKYITLDDGIQQFYKGGKYLRMGDNKVFFSDNGRVKSFKIKEIDYDGTVLYKSRIFTESDYEEKTNSDELEKIIDNQQNIIEVMTEKLNKNQVIIKHLNEKNKKYEAIIQKLMSDRNL